MKKKRYGVGVQGKRGRIFYKVKADGTLQTADFNYNVYDTQTADFNYNVYTTPENAQKAIDRVTVGGAALLQVIEIK